MKEEAFQSLIDAVCDYDHALIDCLDPDELTPEQSRELVLLLATEPLLREELSQRHDFASGMAKRLEISHIKNQRQFRAQVLGRLGRFRQRTYRQILPWGIAAVLALLLVWSHFLPKDTGKASLSVEGKDLTARGTTAVLVASANASYAPDHGPDGIRFDPGYYVLKGGSIHLRFLNGVDLAIHGPARFTIENSFHINLKQGISRALVPDSGIGFTIATAEMKVIDLGTEFGVSAGPEASEVLVFEGRVDVARPGRAKQALATNESLRLTQKGVVETAAIPALNYPTMDSIRQQQWEQWSNTVKTDPDLLLYLNFQQKPDKNGVLKSVSSLRDPPVATVRGARWVTGRWSGKGALLFDGDGDHVEFDLGGGFEELTFCLWMKISRVDYPITSLINSNSWGQRKVHLQLRRAGHITGSLFEEANARSSTPFQTGEWMHVAYVISTRTHQHRIFVNGSPAGQFEMTHSADTIAPGTMRLADWVPVKNTEFEFLKRGFRGFIDECLIFRRALSEEEIAAQVTHGRPSFLWK